MGYQASSSGRLAAVKWFQPCVRIDPFAWQKLIEARSSNKGLKEKGPSLIVYLEARRGKRQLATPLIPTLTLAPTLHSTNRLRFASRRQLSLPAFAPSPLSAERNFGQPATYHLLPTKITSNFFTHSSPCADPQWSRKQSTTSCWAYVIINLLILASDC